MASHGQKRPPYVKFLCWIPCPMSLFDCFHSASIPLGYQMEKSSVRVHYVLRWNTAPRAAKQMYNTHTCTIWTQHFNLSHSNYELKTAGHVHWPKMHLKYLHSEMLLSLGYYSVLDNLTLLKLPLLFMEPHTELLKVEHFSKHSRFWQKKLTQWPMCQFFCGNWNWKICFFFARIFYLITFW